MNPSELRALLKLYAVSGIGPSRLRNLISIFGSAQAAIKAPIQKLIRIKGIENHTAQLIRNGTDDAIIDKQLTYFEKNDIRILSCWDNEFPVRLKMIYDAPVFLFCKGDISVFGTDTVGIVGSREPSSYGKIVTEKLSRDLVSFDLTIVSGLARGIDTIAHRTVVEAGGRTIAVLGSGFDYLYPPENKNLANKITEKGLVISEYLNGAIPDPSNFPRRNRIISGLSLGIVVTEAGSTSGALITAYQALDQNREVFAVPGPINSAKSVGVNQLIKQGAKLVQGSQDIIQEFQNQRTNVNQTQIKVRIPTLEDFEKEIFEMLSEEPVHIDFIAEQVRRSIQDVLSVLLTLELLGIVKQFSGKMFARSLN